MSHLSIMSTHLLTNLSKGSVRKSLSHHVALLCEKWPCAIFHDGPHVVPLLSHTYPGLYLGKKKCAWKITLITFLKWQVDNLNLEFKKNFS